MQCCNCDSFFGFQKFLLDAAPEVSETCQVAIDGIEWRIENAEKRESLLENAEFSSVDPAPPASKKEKSVEQLRDLLLNPDKPTFKRYRALFSLRNINTTEAVLAVCDALNTGSDLFRHEVAFVLGQMEHPASVPALVKALQDTTQHAMVRHEAAEALGSIASPEVISHKHANFGCAGTHSDSRICYRSCSCFSSFAQTALLLYVNHATLPAA